MDEWEIRRELEGRPAWTPGDQKKSGKTTKKTSTAPQASPRSLRVAEDFVAAARDAGFELPFNANFLANRISAKAGGDERLKPVILAGNDSKAEKWLRKMVERFWAEYVTEEDTATRVADVFLDQVWDDLRDYAYNCLKAAYLKEFGRPKEYQPVPHTETDLHKELEDLRLRQYVDQARSAEARELRKFAESQRSVLSSAKEKRRNG